MIPIPARLLVTGAVIGSRRNLQAGIYSRVKHTKYLTDLEELRFEYFLRDFREIELAIMFPIFWDELRRVMKFKRHYRRRK